MTKKILVILGHPALDRLSFCEVLALAYQKGAQTAGHEVQLLKLAKLDFDPILHEGYQGKQSAETDILAAQDQLRWAELLIFVYPMWGYMVPALLKGFFERAFTPGFAYAVKSRNPLKRALLEGKSARLIQTMGMPSLFYRFYFMGHGAKALKSMLGFCGIRPVNITYFGTIEGSDQRRKRYIAIAAALGNAGI